MAMYIVLVNFTDQGVRNLKDTTKRADAIRDMAKKFGVTLKEIYWTLGSYDIVGISKRLTMPPWRRSWRASVPWATFEPGPCGRFPKQT
jgi:hypothetical protein